MEFPFDFFERIECKDKKNIDELNSKIEEDHIEECFREGDENWCEDGNGSDETEKHFEHSFLKDEEIEASLIHAKEMESGVFFHGNGLHGGKNEKQ